MITLRQIRESDLPTTLQWRNADRVRGRFVNSAVIDEFTHFRWFKEEMAKQPKPLGWIICDDARPIGQCWLYDIDAASATFGRFMIGEDDAIGKGYGKGALLLVIEHARKLGLKRLSLSVKADNFNAIHLYRRVGFADSHSHDGMIEMELSL